MRDGRLLVTGATGLVGRHVVEEAARRGFEVHAVTSRDGGGRVGGVTWHVADLTERGGAARLLATVRPTHLVHAAWDTRHGTYWRSAANLAWVAATAEMAGAFADNGGRRFVLVGTGAEYDWGLGLMIEGRTPERPATPYGRCKLAAHHAVQGAAHLGFTAVTARIFWSYGPGENPNRLIPYVCRRYRAGETPALGSGRQLRDLLHARDTARALLVLAEHDALTGAVNIGSGRPVSLGEVVTRLAGMAGMADRTGLGARPDQPDDPLVLLPSVDRLLSTGWAPEIGLEDGLRATFAWWAENDARGAPHDGGA